MRKTSTKAGMRDWTMHKGSVVRLVNTGSDKLNGALAEVEQVTGWGAHVRTHATATGRYRATFGEMEPVVAEPSPPPSLPPGIGEGDSVVDLRVPPRPPPEIDWVGSPCDTCGSIRVVRRGPCALCLDCGTSGGCS